MPWYDFVLMIIGAGCFFYFAINAMTLIRLSTRIQPIHVVIGCVGILVLIELCRRCVGLPILFVLGALLNGRALADACALAGEFVKDCIAYTAAQHTDPMHGVQFEKLLPRLFSCHENRTEV